MGFFSQECTDCQCSVLSPYVTDGENSWLADAVVITPEGNIHRGVHDGYGTVGEVEHAIGFDNTVWHEACWELAGQPGDYLGASPHANDQGYFFDPGEYDILDPRQS
jgi:hypothetical protein